MISPIQIYVYFKLYPCFPSRPSRMATTHKHFKTQNPHAKILNNKIIFIFKGNLIFSVEALRPLPIYKAIHELIYLIWYFKINIHLLYYTMLLIVKLTVASHMSLKNQPKDNKFWKQFAGTWRGPMLCTTTSLCVKPPFHLMHTVNNPEGLVSELSLHGFENLQNVLILMTLHAMSKSSWVTIHVPWCWKSSPQARNDKTAQQSTHN